MWDAEETADCDHQWVPAGKLTKRGAPIASSLAYEKGLARVKHASQGEFCQFCPAWRGVLGLEPTVDLYIQHMVAIMDEVKRVLRDDGTVWLNIGDSYDPRTHQRQLVPHRLALALQAAGWLVRSDIIWAKGYSFCASSAGSVMPESVRDRPTCSHEHVILLAKSKKYWYDYEAAREPGRLPAGTRAAKGSGAREGNRRPAEYTVYDGQRNPRDVWAINTRPFAQAHFATFPPSLVLPCLRAGAPAQVCAPCGTPYRHVVERTPVPILIQEQLNAARIRSADVTGRRDGHTSYKPSKGYQRQILGEHFTQQCECGAVLQPAGTASESPTVPIQPGLVLDPFCGSGTVGLVAQQLGLRFVGLDASSQYLTDIAQPRLSGGSKTETVRAVASPASES